VEKVPTFQFYSDILKWKLFAFAEITEEKLGKSHAKLTHSITDKFKK